MFLNIYLSIFVVTMFFIILWILKLSQFFEYIKKNDLKTFEYLGRPGMLIGNNITTNLKLMTYLFKKEYLNFEDQITKEKAAFLRFILITTLSIMFFGTILKTFGELYFGVKLQQNWFPKIDKKQLYFNPKSIRDILILGSCENY
jgi:hypothetical protein